MNEEWAIIPSAPRYSASTLGRIRREVPYRGNHLRRVLAPQDTGNGYLSVNIHQQSRYVHRLVCEAFRGVQPKECPQVSHLDGDRTNNRPDNLVWASPLENEAQKTEHGTRKVGSAVANSKLTEADVVAIREAVAKGTLPKARIAREFNIHPTMVKRIADRTAWRHVK